MYDKIGNFFPVGAVKKISISYCSFLCISCSHLTVARVRAGWSPWKLEVVSSASLKMANIHYQLDLELPRRNITGCVGEDVSREV